MDEYEMNRQANAPGESSWYAALTRSRHEKSAASMLISLGISHFLPLVTEVRRWSDRKQKVSVPLFPSYVFVKIGKSSDELLRILKVPGVVSFVGNSRGPVAIPEEEIQSIQTVLASGVGFSPYPFLAAGDRVRIVHGPLAGVEGNFVRTGPDSKLVISIEMIQRSVAISVDGCDLEPVYRRQPEYVYAEQDHCRAEEQGQLSL
jgi:transcription termination/antitermination protein NusG